MLKFCKIICQSGLTVGCHGICSSLVNSLKFFRLQAGLARLLNPIYRIIYGFTLNIPFPISLLYN